MNSIEDILEYGRVLFNVTLPGGSKTLTITSTRDSFSDRSVKSRENETRCMCKRTTSFLSATQSYMTSATINANYFKIFHRLLSQADLT